MSIWIGHDGTLNDDDGDGPAMPSSEYVGEDDFFSSALSSMGSGSGGSGLGGSSGASNLGSMFGGDSSGEGGGLADLFGKAAEVAIPILTKAATQAMTKPSAPASSAPSSSPPSSSPVRIAPSHPTAARAHARANAGGGDPRARLNVMLSHLAKKYQLPAPLSGGGSVGQVGDFVSKMMGGPKSDAAAQVAGMYVGEDLGDVFGEIATDALSSSLHHAHPAHDGMTHHGHHRRPVTFTVPTLYGSDPYSNSSSHYASHSQAYPHGQQAQPVSYSQQPATYSPSQSPSQSPVTYSPYAMPSNQKSNGQAPAGKKVGDFISKMMGGSAYGDSTSLPATSSHKASSGPVSESLRHTQKLLNTFWGHQVLVEDGIMGPNTIRFIKEFQRQAHLPVTGLDDTGTRAALSPDGGGGEGRGGGGGEGRGDLSGTVPGAASYLPSSGGQAGIEPDWGGAIKKTAQYWLQPPPLTIEQQLSAEQNKSKIAARGFYVGDETGWWMT